MVESAIPPGTGLGASVIMKSGRHTLVPGASPEEEAPSRQFCEALCRTEGRGDAGREGRGSSGQRGLCPRRAGRHSLLQPQQHPLGVRDQLLEGDTQAAVSVGRVGVRDQLLLRQPTFL